MPNYSDIALPLTDLTRKGCPSKVVWGEAQEKSYQTLKSMLVKPPVLKLPDFSKQFIDQTDSSDTGMGTVLQDHFGILHPIYYASKKLLPLQRNYSIVERECMCIVWAVQKFELYLYEREFVIQTDHQPLVYINQCKVINKKVMRWAMFLQEFRFRIESIPDRLNHGPDFLSRVPIMVE